MGQTSRGGRPLPDKPRRAGRAGSGVQERCACQTRQHAHGGPPPAPELPELRRVPMVLTQSCSKLGALPSPLWGGVGGGGREVSHSTVRNAPPPCPNTSVQCCQF